MASTTPNEPDETLHDRLLELQKELRTRRESVGGEKRTASLAFAHLTPLVLQGRRKRNSEANDKEVKRLKCGNSEDASPNEDDDTGNVDHDHVGPLVSSLDYYKGLLEKVKADEQKQVQNADMITKKVKEVRSVYLFGLQKVSNLQNLASAPDAFLPGNFCVTKSEDSETTPVS